MTRFNFDILPAEIRGRGSPEAKETVVALVNEAPRAMTMKEIMQVLEHNGINAGTLSTVRDYLSSAAREGLISKPTRDTYAPVNYRPGRF
ncbi:MAG: hypothetical protein GDA52_09630 [Rhodobacteraceae bacterium]|nr:hypothetical protein [Paracoccaceae bacterium]